MENHALSFSDSLKEHPTKQQAKKIAGLCILAIAFLLPSGLYFLVLPVLAIVGICRIVGGDFRLRGSKFKGPGVLFPILLYLYIVIQFFFSLNFGEAFSSLSTKLPFLLFPLIIGTSVVEKDLSNRAMKVFAGSVCLWMAAALLYAFIDMTRTHQNTIQIGESIYKKYSWYGLTRLFDNWHPSYVSLFCNLAIAVLLGLPAKEWAGRRFSRVYLLLAFLFLSISVFLLYSITGIIIYCCLLLFFGYKWLRRYRLPLVVNLGLVLLIVGLLAGVVYANPMKLGKIDKLMQKGWKATDQEDERNVLTIRLAKWMTYLEVSRKNLLFGTTSGDIKEQRKKVYEEKGYKDLALHNYNAHNEYLEMLATCGIIGFGIFLIILLAALFRAGGHPLLLPFMIISLIAFSTESILERQQGLNFFLFFYSLLMLPWPAGEKESPRS
jgi:O-antigen ligase